MKLTRRLSSGLIALGLSISLLVTSQTSPAAWQSFVSASQQWGKSLVGLFSHVQIGEVVSAQAIQDELQNWQNWPSSQKHKDFDGGWILPFEAFSQQYYRGWQNRNRPPQYFDKPIQIDMNGDGLQDLLYSKANIALHGQTQNFIPIGVEQYLILRRANGFELAYKCRQESRTIFVPPFNTQKNEYWYYGDCADLSYTSGTSAAYELPWTPGGFWYQQTPNMSNSNLLKNENRQDYMGTNDDVFEYLNVDMNINGNYVETIDRSMPKITDLNGDGLPDIVFFGNASIGEQYGTNNTPAYVSTNFVLYNNGRGFDVEAGCIQQFYNWYPPNYAIPPGAVSPQQGMYCF